MVGVFPGSIVRGLQHDSGSSRHCDRIWHSWIRSAERHEQKSLRFRELGTVRDRLGLVPRGFADIEPQDVSPTNRYTRLRTRQQGQLLPPVEPPYRPAPLPPSTSGQQGTATTRATETAGRGQSTRPAASAAASRAQSSGAAEGNYESQQHRAFYLAALQMQRRRAASRELASRGQAERAMVSPKLSSSTGLSPVGVISDSRCLDGHSIWLSRTTMMRVCCAPRVCAHAGKGGARATDFPCQHEPRDELWQLRDAE
jgi:hypothetical protein